MTTAFREVSELRVSQLDKHLYGYEVTHGHTVLFGDEGFAGVAEALLDAAGEGKDLLGLQVSYQGIVAGTYLPGELMQASEGVADLCIANSAKFAFNGV
ncbi:hypothetical protein AACH06_25585 [Ideonella sp. DXS29W]|uniref:Uncharacterized protein n=1 Tax=Ideonella lacteola TaxID=2984193 RepID=A0ABU9C0L1_9BURK